jgi:serine/threonine protein kinase, bacterial
VDSLSWSALPITGLGNMPYTEGLAVDSAGTLYVADGKNRRVVKLLPGSSTPTELPFAPGEFPTSVAVDSSGNLYVTASKEKKWRVLEFAAGSSTPTELPFTGLSGVVGVAVDRSGNVFVAESGADSAKDKVIELPVR